MEKDGTTMDPADIVAMAKVFLAFLAYQEPREDLEYLANHLADEQPPEPMTDRQASTPAPST